MIVERSKDNYDSNQEKNNKNDDDINKNNNGNTSKAIAGLIIVVAILSSSAISVLGIQSFSSREINSTANTISTSLIQQASAQMQLPSTSTLNSNNITSSPATTLSSVKEQTRMHQQSVAATNLSAATKQKGKVSDDVVGVLVYYARATGEQFPGTFNFTNANA